MGVDKSGIRSLSSSISEPQKKIVRLIAGSGGINIPQSYVNERINRSRQSISKLINKLNDLDVLDIDKRDNKNFLTLKQNAFPVIFSDSPNETNPGRGLQSVDRSNSMNSPMKGSGKVEDSGIFRIHGVQIVFEFQDQYNLENKRESFVKQNLFNWKYHDSNDEYIGYRKGNQFRILSNKIVFYLNDFIGYNIHDLKRKVFDEVLKSKSWIENNSDFVLKEDFDSFEIFLNKQHIALVGELFGRFIDEETNFSISDFKVWDEDQDLLYYEWDKSKDVVEIESKNNAFSEDLIRRSKNFWRSFAEKDFCLKDLENISDFEKILEKLVSDYKELFDLYNDFKGRFDNLEGFVRSLKENKVGVEGNIDEEKDSKGFKGSESVFDFFEFDSSDYKEKRKDLFGF